MGAIVWCVSCSRDGESDAPTSAPVLEARLLPRPHPGVLGFVPALTFKNFQGETVSSEGLLGKPWILLSLPEGKKAMIERVGERAPSELVWVLLGDAVSDVPETTLFTERETVTSISEALAAEKATALLVDAYQRVRGTYDGMSDEVVNAIVTDLVALQAEIVPVPDDVLDPGWMEARAEAQIASAKALEVMHDFQFTDAREECGIRFRHKIVDDSGKRFKGVHYDHGSGVAVADIDGDALLDLYFVNQVGSNALWRNLGDGRFEDITAQAGVFVSDRIGVSASFADIDNDGDPDLYATALRKGNILFENLGNGRFRDITAASGLGYKGHSSGAVFVDYDRDGRLDVLVTNVGQYTTEEEIPVTMESIRGEADTGETYHEGFSDAFGGHLKAERYESSRLYRNVDGRRFVDVSAEVGIEDFGWTGDAAAVDLNTDGWPDFYMLNMQGDDEVYLNREGKRFDRVGREWFPKTPWGSMSIKAFDVENDGDLDLYITDMHSDMSEHIGPEKEKEKAAMQWTESFLKTKDTSIFGNAFFRKSNAGYEEVSDAIGAENYWPWGLSVDDLNADGFDDVFIASSMNFPLRYGVNSVLLNVKGQRFQDAEFVLGVEPRADGAALPWFELDLLGKDRGAPVIEVLGLSEPALAELPERVVVWGAKGSRSSAIIDLDGDGDLDIITNEMNHYPLILKSNLSEKHPDLAYLKVALVGRQSNRSGLGAVVRVTIGERTLMKVKDGQSGYLSHSDYPLYFGLDGAKQVDRVEVTWPSGIVQVIAGPLPSNQLLRIEEDGETSNRPHSGAVPPAANEGNETSAAIEVRPGESIQAALEAAAKDPVRKRVLVHAGTYRPERPGQAMVWFNKRHDGITLEAKGEVTLTAAHPELANQEDASFPAIVNHVVYFGDGVSRDTVLRGFRITGARGFLSTSEAPVSIQPDLSDPKLKKAKFFYTDGGGIKIFGRSYPTIENVEIADNFTSPCGAGISVEHRGFTDGSRLQSVLIRDCVFRDNRCPISGAALDLLHGSSAEVVNCLFVGNRSNDPMDERAETPGKWKPKHGSGALTVFPESTIIVRRCTFTENRNAVDDSNQGNVYADCLFWKNNVSGGWPPGARYELDIASAVGVSGCFIHGDIDDLQNTIDPDRNVLECPDPKLNAAYVPTAEGFENVGYRP